MQRIMQIKEDNKVLYPELSYKICGLCFNVHNELGRFRSEKSYADALEDLLKKNDIKYLREKPFSPAFEEEKERRNIPDFLIEDRVVLDLKVKRIITKEDYFQMKRYLVSGGKKLGLIVNFRQKYISPKRVLN